MVFHGVNESGYESGNDSITDGRDIAWLQDVASVDAWGSWGVEYRDVFVLDGEGRVQGVVNVTEADLGDAANEATLRGYVDDALAGL